MAPGTTRSSSRWAVMLARITKPLRLLVVLVAFVAAGFGHSVAMAEMSSGHHVTIHQVTAGAPHGPTPHQQSHRDCRGHDCGDTSSTCCVMGQCLIGLPLGADTLVVHPCGVVTANVRAMEVAVALPPLPFRPPA